MSVGAYHDVPLVEKGVILKLSADVKCDDVVPGEKPWNSARLMLVQSDGENGQWHLPHVIAFLSGTHDWANYYSYFTIEPETQGIQVVADFQELIESCFLAADSEIGDFHGVFFFFR